MSDEAPTILTPPPPATLAPVLPTCGMCRHWHAIAPQARVTPMGRAVEVGGPQEGECREGPPAVVVVPMQLPDGRVHPETGVLYPPVQANFPACGRFAFNLALLGQARRVGGQSNG